MDFSLSDLDGITLKDLLQLSISYQYKQVGWRAAWVLETVVLANPSYLLAIQDELIESLSVQKDWSSLRSYSKILMELTNPKKSFSLSKEQEEIIIEDTFNWMIDIDCPLAVRCNCMDILYQLSSEHEWIKDELIEQINLFLKTPTPALASRGNKILKRILNS
ncbi:hypothetical protein [Sphingobacterium hungaricum]|nr:hypothetical protein [Sphingobacterium hungaricum]